MTRGKRSTSPKELVRLTPGQFSAAVAGIVLLCSLSLVTGYYLGLKRIGRDKAGSRQGEQKTENINSAEAPRTAAGSSPSVGMATTITFYSALVKGEKKAVAGKKGQRVLEAATSEKKQSVHFMPAVGGNIAVQVASYRKREKAHEMLVSLSSAGYSGTVVRADLGPRGIWHRVRLGPFRSKGDAEKILAVLKDERSIKGFIVR